MLDDDIDLYNILPNPDQNDSNDPDLMLNIPTSNYLSLTKLNKLLQNADSSPLSMYHFNTRSLQNNIDILKEFVYSLTEKPSIIGITETKLNEQSIDNIEMLGYKFRHNDSPTKAGGTAIYISKSISHDPRTDIQFHMNFVESTWVEIHSLNGKSNIIIGCIYRHPNADMNQYTIELKNILHKLNQENKQIFIMGDINIDFLKYHIDTKTEEYLDMLFVNGFLPLITKPTRITDHSRTLIDHIYTNHNPSKIIPGIATFDISDHLPVFCIVDTHIKKIREENIFFRDYSKFDKDKYIEELCQTDWEKIYTDSKDLHDATQKTIERITSIVNSHVPLKTVPQNKKKLYFKPWITKGILRSIKRKQQMYRTHFLSNDIQKAEQYKRYANKLNKLKALSKKQYYEKRFEKYKNNLKNTWKLIGTIIKRENKGQSCITKIIRNNKTYYDTTDIANQLNKHFTSVGPNLAKTIESTNEDPCHYINNSPVNSFNMIPVSLEQVREHFSSLVETKSSIGIPNKLIKMASNQISIPLHRIYNESINTGIVPNIFKISRITPIHKSGTHTDPNNYRPVAVLSSFSKVLEKLIHDQLISFIEKHNILYEYQFGFRKGHSTEQAILEITDNLKLNIDKKLITCGVFLDLTKAFDTINHNILLSKLYKYGIRGTPFLWFKSYIENRQQYVKINDIESDLLKMDCGVPQGSTLGPLLFLLYVNDMANASSKLLFRMFADDTNIFYAAKTPQELQKTMNEELQHLLKYCATNKLSVNMKKTNFMIVSTKKCYPPIQISNIEYKSYIKYLGVYIDDKLNWSYQISHVNNKMAKNIGIIKKLRYYINLKMLKQLYYNLIYPFLTYAILSWGNTYKTRLTKIVTKQNKVVRQIFFANSRENANPLYKILDILKFENILKHKIGCFTFKILNKSSSVPKPFTNYLQKASNVHSYNTRYAKNLNIQRPKIRTNYGIHSSKYLASKVWETIPKEIKNSTSFIIFKIRLKTYLLQEQ